MGRRFAVFSALIVACLAASGCGASLLGTNESLTGSYVGTFQNSSGTQGEMTMNITSSNAVSGTVVTTTPSGSIGTYTYTGNIASNGFVTLNSSAGVTASGTLTLVGSLLQSNLNFSNNTNSNIDLEITSSGSVPAYAGSYSEGFTNNSETGTVTLIVDQNGNIFGYAANNTTDYTLSGTIASSGATSLLLPGNVTYSGTLTLTGGQLTGTLSQSSNTFVLP